MNGTPQLPQFAVMSSVSFFFVGFYDLFHYPDVQGMQESFRKRIDQISRGRPVTFFFLFLTAGFTLLAVLETISGTLSILNINDQT